MSHDRFHEFAMKSVTDVEAESHFSALLAKVEAGEEIAITRHGKVVARLIPDHPIVAADAFREFWMDKDDIDLSPPEDPQEKSINSLDE
jgi:prevent-host-death family protein